MKVLDVKDDPLVAIAAMVPWESLRPKLKACVITGGLGASDVARKSPAGRKPWDEVVIFKALVLQALYNLSDDQAEYQLRDRLSLMRFLGLGLAHAGPAAKPTGAETVRTTGIVRARCKIGITNLVYNMRRFII